MDRQLTANPQLRDLNVDLQTIKARPPQVETVKIWSERPALVRVEYGRTHTPAHGKAIYMIGLIRRRTTPLRRNWTSAPISPRRGAARPLLVRLQPARTGHRPGHGRVGASDRLVGESSRPSRRLRHQRRDQLPLRVGQIGRIHATVRTHGSTSNGNRMGNFLPSATSARTAATCPLPSPSTRRNHKIKGLKTRS